MAKCRKKKKIAQVRMTMAQMAEAKRRPLSREEPEQKQERNKGIRALVDCQIRAVEGEGNERTFVLSFSSEAPYTRWFGQEILDHTGECADLTRLNSIGVVLYNHKRDKVIGKINKAWIEDQRGYAEITFDSDDPTVGVGRSMTADEAAAWNETYARQLQYNKNIARGGKSR